ncbi:hypothetical protein LCGC14_1702280 [marine sediment metagenome]|uniref:Uncharacterized protein n=1 Tax=marine sediment metagenome TaxID=412755 RepID=A0A0F9HHA7_9ZZZZ
MKRFSILMIVLVAIVGFTNPAFANDAGSHCEQFGDDHPGCGGEGSDPGDDGNFTNRGFHNTDYDFPVNTAAPVFAGNCAQGMSAQTMGFGGSIASGNSVCDFIAVAGAFIAGGERAEAFRVLGKAEKAADWRFLFSRIRMVITLGLL